MKLFKRIFQKRPQSFLLDNMFRIVPAFQLKGEIYYMHEDPIHTATGRGLTAMVFLEELLMRCSVEYLKAHIEACDKIFTNPQKIDIPSLIKLHNNLKERVHLLVALPKNVYKLASIVFFTKEESPYKYDQVYNEQKIKKWQQSADMYDFFLQTPLKKLIPFLELPNSNSQDYLKVVEKINQLHLNNLSEILSKPASTIAA